MPPARRRLGRGGGASAAAGGASGAGVSSIGPDGRSCGGGVYGVDAAAAPSVSAAGWPHAKLWNSSDAAAPAVVPWNGAGVSGFGVSLVPRPARRAAPPRRQRGPSSPMMISSKSSQATAADCVRCVGSLTSIFSIQSEMPWSTSGSIDFTGAIGSLTCRSRIAIGASESWNGTLPVNSSKAMQPTE